MPQNVTVLDTLRVLVENKKYSSVKEILATMNPYDIAALFDELSEQELPILFRLLSKDTAAETFVEMEPEHQELLIRSFSDTELKQVIDELYVDDAADLVEDMPANVVYRILKQANPDVRKSINEILKYPEDSAGSVMTTEVITLKENMTVADAFDVIRENGVDKETIYTCYVTKNHKIVGIVSAKDLMLAKDKTTLIKDLMTENVITVNVHTDQEEVANMFKKYNFLAMPVVDKDDLLVGIITFDDVMDVIEEETTEDIEMMAGMTPSEKPYLHSSPWEIFLHRIPWLMVLMIGATFTSMIITHYETALAAQLVLTAFIPMLMGTGGNSGSQSSVTIIRAISLGELEFNDLPKVILKEFLTSVLCGLSLAMVCFAKIILLDGMLMHNADITATVALTVSIAMFGTVIMAKLVGSVLPICANRLGFDPAVMANPLITTCVDALSLVVFFEIASSVLL